MKTLASNSSILIVAAWFALFSAQIRAQSYISNTITHEEEALVGDPGRDFWITELSYDWGINIGGTYTRIYITSPNNTTAYVTYNGATTPLTVSANEISDFLVPEYWENESSGIVESKAIHVWSNDADLVVYNMSQGNIRGDGTFVIPTVGWGTDYVVAAYESYYVSIGNYSYDLPSEMAVVANQDNTEVTIIPSCNCRQCTSGTESGDTNSTIVVFVAGAPVTFPLNRGQDVELMPVKATGFTGFDMSGTIVHANVPVGVIGGAALANIPSRSQYPSFIEEMIPPVRLWGTNYFTTNFAEPDTLPLHDSAMYLFAASQAGQTIFRSTCIGGNQTECTIAKQYGIFYGEARGAQKFWSAEPFLCVEYMNSSSYPDGRSGIGAPSEVAINPYSQFTKNVAFQAADDGGSYSSYANITVNMKDASKTLINGNPIFHFPSQCLDSNWEIFVVDLLLGINTVSGDDSGVGVYVYGYGSSEAYAWSTPGAYEDVVLYDTLPPVAKTSMQCYTSEVYVTDSGMLPNDSMQSGLANIVLDSDYNMTFSGATSNGNPFIEGSGVPSADYSLYVNDITKPAILIVDVYDKGGNETIITSTYTPAFDTIVPPLQDLGVQIAPAPQNIADDTIDNNSQAPVTIDKITLKYGNKGFSIHDSTGGVINLPITLQPGNRYLIEIQFVSPPGITGASFDSIIVSTSCNTQEVALVGSDGANDFTVTNQTWINDIVPTPANGYQKTVTIANLSGDAIVIDSASWTNTIHFKAMSSFPITVPEEMSFSFAYFPDANSARVPDTAIVTWYSHNVLISGTTNPSPRFDMLIGDAISSDVAFSTIPTSPIVRSIDGELIQVTLPSNWLNTNLEIYTMLGQRVYVGMIPSSTTLDLGSLPRGVYFWRLKSNGESQAGKILLGE